MGSYLYLYLYLSMKPVACITHLKSSGAVSLTASDTASETRDLASSSSKREEEATVGAMVEAAKRVAPRGSSKGACGLRARSECEVVWKAQNAWASLLKFPFKCNPSYLSPVCLDGPRLI